MRVLVTGATGFIGGRLARALAADGHEVRALVRPGADAARLAAAGVAIVRGDVTDEGAVAAATRGCELVHHLAVSPRHARPGVLDAVNVAAAGHVVRAAGRTGARVVHCSSTNVYGRLSRLPADEDHPTRPDRPYPASKLRGEALVGRLAREQGTSVVIARLSSVYGPGSRRGLKVYRDALGGTLFTIGPSTQLDDLVFVDDIVDGLRRCGELRDARAPVYNLAGGAPRPLCDVYRAIAAAGGTPLRQRPLPVLPFRALAATQRATRLGASLDSPLLHRLTHVPRSRAFSIDRARRDLGYRPAVGLEEGAARTLAWYREAGLLSPQTKERAA